MNLLKLIYYLLIFQPFNNKKIALSHSKIVETRIVIKKHINKEIKSWITSTYNRKSERTKERRTCNFKDNKKEKISSTSDKKDKKNEEYVNGRNGLPNIYECGKKICHLTYKRICI